MAEEEKLTSRPPEVALPMDVTDRVLLIRGGRRVTRADETLEDAEDGGGTANPSWQKTAPWIELSTWRLLLVLSLESILLVVLLL